MNTPEELAKAILVRSFTRFWKGFVTGGLSAVVLIQPPLSSDPSAVLAWVKIVAGAFIVGGILGIEKLLTQVYGSNQTPPSNPSNNF